MRHLYKSALIGLITVSFIFTPSVFARPVGQKIKTKDLNRVLKVIKKSKKGVNVSRFLESTKPLFKRKVYKKITKDAFPYWDKKISKVVFGKDYVKMKYKGKTLFAKYVDRGSIAFIVNNKPLLWKDMLTYRKTKARLKEILSGKKSKKKVGVLNKFFGRMSDFAFAKDDGNGGGTVVAVPAPAPVLGGKGASASTQGQKKPRDEMSYIAECLEPPVVVGSEEAKCCDKGRGYDKSKNKCDSCLENFIPAAIRCEDRTTIHC